MQDQIISLTAVIRSMQSNPAPSEARTSLVGPATGAYALPYKQRALRRVSVSETTPFQGPTTSAYGFGLAKSSLEQRGIVEPHELGDGDLTQEPSPLSSPAPNQEYEPRSAVDPLWALPKSEALRLCQVYHFEMGIMYPVLEFTELQDQVNILYEMMNSPMDLETQINEHDTLEKEDVFILRLVFACALTAEASGRSEKAMAFFDSMREVQDDYVWGRPEIKSIMFLTLVVRLSKKTPRDFITDTFHSQSFTFRWTKKL